MTTDRIATRCVLVTLAVGLLMLIPLSYLPTACERFVIFDPWQSTCLVLLIDALLVVVLWHAVSFASTQAGMVRAVVTCSVLAVAQSTATSVAPWLWRPPVPEPFQFVLYYYWAASTAVTGWLQLWLKEILEPYGAPGYPPYWYPWGEHFHYAGPWRCLRYHSLVAVPAWFLVFISAWVASRAVRRLTTA